MSYLNLSKNWTIRLFSSICIFILIQTLGFSQTYRLGAGFTNGATVNTCAGTFTDAGGAAANYGNNENYTVSFCSNNGQPISFNFTSFNVETTGGTCNNDFLEIYDGTNTAAPLIGRYCGTALPGIVTSSGTCLTFRFVSNATVVQVGWSATISCINCALASCTSFSNLAFANPTQVANPTGMVGDRWRFPNVLAGYDALVEIIATNQIGFINSIDNAASPVGVPNAWSPEINVIPTAGQDSYVDWKITIVTAGTSTPSNLPSSSRITSIDVDSDGTTDFTEIHRHLNSNGYILNNPTDLTIQSTPPYQTVIGAAINYPAVSFDDKAKVTFYYAGTNNVFNIRLGIRTVVSKAAQTRLFALIFDPCVTYANADVNPVTPRIVGLGTGCVNGSNSLYSTSAFFTSYTWSVTGGTIISGQGTRNAVVDWSSSGNHVVYITTVDANGCTVSSSFPVVVTNTPENCTNGVDDDCDGLVDCSDTDCPCTPPPIRNCKFGLGGFNGFVNFFGNPDGSYVFTAQNGNFGPTSGGPLGLNNIGLGKFTNLLRLTGNYYGTGRNTVTVDNILTSSIALSDGNLLLVGHTYSAIGAGYMRSFVTKISQTGTVLWNTSVDETTSLYTQLHGAVEIIGQNQAWVVGYPDSLISTGASVNNNFKLYRLNLTTGALIDNYQYTNNWYPLAGYGIDRATGVSVFTNGDPVIWGFSDISTTSTLKGQVLMRIDQNNGNITWAKKGQTTGQYDFSNGNSSILMESNEDVVACGRVEPTVGSGTHDANIVKVSSTGAPIFNKLYKTSEAEFFSRIRKTPEGDYLIAGTIGPDGLVMKISNVGAVLWAKRYTGGQFTDIWISDASNYIVVGQKNVTASDKDMWLLSLDNNGGSGLTNCETNVIFTVSDLAVMTNVTFRKQIKSSTVPIVFNTVSGLIASYCQSCNGEVCGNGIDEDLNGLIDENCPGPNVLCVNRSSDRRTGTQRYSEVVPFRANRLAYLMRSTKVGSGLYDFVLRITDLNGNVVREKSIGTATNYEGYTFDASLTYTSTNRFMVGGIQSNDVLTSDYPFFVCLDTNLNIQWQNRIDPGGAEYNNLTAGVQTDVNEITYVGDEATATVSGGIFIRLRISDGAVISAGIYPVPTSGHTTSFFDVVNTGAGTAVVSGGYFGIVPGQWSAMHTSISNGNTPIWGRYYSGNAGLFWSSSDGDNGSIVSVGTNLVNNNPIVIKTNIQGNVVWSKEYSVAGYTYSACYNPVTFEVTRSPCIVQLADDSGYLIADAITISGQQDIILTKIDQFGNVVWSRIYGKSTVNELITDGQALREFSNRFVILASQVTAGIDNELQIVTDKVNGASGSCDNIAATVVAANFATTPIAFLYNPVVTPTFTSITNVASNVTSVPLTCCPVEICGNGLDDDLDGPSDCLDTECPSTPANANNNGPNCTNSNIQLTGGPVGMNSYSWTGPNGFSSTLQNPLLQSILNAQAGIYTLNITNSFACTTSATTTVVVNPAPPQPGPIGF
jgi:hypothetical protein